MFVDITKYLILITINLYTKLFYSLLRVRFEQIGSDAEHTIVLSLEMQLFLMISDYLLERLINFRDYRVSISSYIA